MANRSPSPRRKSKQEIIQYRHNIAQLHAELVEECHTMQINKISAQEFRLKYNLKYPNEDKEYALSLYMSEYDARLRVVKAKNTTKRKRTKSSSSNKCSIPIPAAAQHESSAEDDDEENQSSKRSKIEKTIVHVIPRMYEYASPNCAEELIACHITDPLSQEQIEQMIQKDSTKLIWFWDIESIPMIIDDIQECFADSVLIGAYGQSCTTSLKFTPGLERLVQNGQFRLVSSGSGKERADGMLDILVMDLHNRIHDKNIHFVILSNDSGFDSLACTVSSQQREMIRVSVRGNPQASRIYNHACKALENNSNTL
jgi:hypothetical protein